jgi:UrcA family protein
MATPSLGGRHQSLDYGSAKSGRRLIVPAPVDWSKQERSLPMKTAFIKSAAIAFTALAAVAGAAHADGDPTREIEFQPSQLQSEHGLTQLRERIAQSALDVCQYRGPELELRRARQACVQEAVEQAEAQLERKVAEASQRRFAAAETSTEAKG